MRRMTVVTGTLALVLAMTGASSVFAGEFNTKLSIGDAAPGFDGLTGTDGKTHSLNDYKDAKVVVISFTCNHCPVATAYEGRFVDFVKQYRDKGVTFVAINVNNIPADRLDAMKKRAEEKGFNFDYLFDPGQEVGRAYGATVTPHMFVLCPERKVAYMGSFDDSKDPKKVKSQFVRDAVDALLAGNTPEVKETKQFGCGIRYEAAGKIGAKPKATSKPKSVTKPKTGSTKTGGSKAKSQSKTGSGSKAKVGSKNKSGSKAKAKSKASNKKSN